MRSISNFGQKCHLRNIICIFEYIPVQAVISSKSISKLVCCLIYESNTYKKTNFIQYHWYIDDIGSLMCRMSFFRIQHKLVKRSFKGWVCFHENGSYPYKIKVQLKLINLICNNYILGCPLSNYSHLKNPILISACIN